MLITLIPNSVFQNYFEVISFYIPPKSEPHKITKTCWKFLLCFNDWLISYLHNEMNMYQIYCQNVTKAFYTPLYINFVSRNMIRFTINEKTVPNQDILKSITHWLAGMCGHAIQGRIKLKWMEKLFSYFSESAEEKRKRRDLPWLEWRLLSWQHGIQSRTHQLGHYHLYN